jgi:hypothetical protein
MTTAGSFEIATGRERFIGRPTEIPLDYYYY